MHGQEAFHGDTQLRLPPGHAGELVRVDVLIQGQHEPRATRAQEGDASQHEHVQSKFRH